MLGLVLDHHERLDGSGYPRGLRGEELDVETRVLAVCDVYDALVSHRVYRPAWKQERALALLRDPAGVRRALRAPRSSGCSRRFVAAWADVGAAPLLARHRRRRPDGRQRGLPERELVLARRPERRVHARTRAGTRVRAGRVVSSRHQAASAWNSGSA